MKNICVIGASFAWTRTLVGDLLAVFPDEALEIRFVDIVAEHAAVCCAWGNAANAAYGRKDVYRQVGDRAEALKGADAVLITLSTGGLDAMAADIAIPERYGIYATVGDTAGPGGWSRSIRNIPVFAQIAEDAGCYCPDAIIANYTNPMSTLTATLALGCDNPVVGLCHAYFETKDVIQKIFGLPDWTGLSVEIAGMNHFTWVTDFRINGRKGYPLLREKLKERAFASLLPEESSDDWGIVSSHRLFAELFAQYGYLCYPADRHICEFVPFAVVNPVIQTGRKDKDGIALETLQYCGLVRTPVAQRVQMAKASRETMLRETARLSSSHGLVPPKSRETGAEMIRGYLCNTPVVDAVNALNKGQIAGLPRDACVETMGVVDGFGVRPLQTGTVPEALLALMRPQAYVTGQIVRGMLGRDRRTLVNALGADPQCAHLAPGRVAELAEELFAANAAYTGGFLGRRGRR